MNRNQESRRGAGRWWWWAVIVSFLLSSCGGGTSAIESFVPSRLIVFGDETSLMTDDGRTYSINGLDANNLFDCTVQPNWTHGVAISYGFRFEQCKAGLSEFKAVRRATVGAKADDLAAQIAEQDRLAPLNSRDLATVLIGANDIIELYQTFPTRSEADITAELDTRAARAAAQINALIAKGPRVIVVTVPDLGFSPYAKAQKASFSDTDRAALLTRLVYAYNARIRLDMLNDGRYVGLVLSDEQVQVIHTSPGSFGLTNAEDAACRPGSAPPTCDLSTLVDGATPSTYLWAGDIYPGPVWHARVASLAESRARLNPF